MKKLIQIFRSRIKIIVGVLILAVIIFLIAGKKEVRPLIVKVVKGDVVQEVVVTGVTKSRNSADLAFIRGGKIAAVYVREGERVSEGARLVALDASDLAADLREAEANVAVEKAKLNELLRGTRKEELQVSEVKVRNAESTLKESDRSLLDSIKDSYVKSDDAVRSRMDQLFLTPRTNPKILFYIADSQLRFNLETQRKEVEKTLQAWSQKIAVFSDESQVVSFAAESKGYLTAVRQLLESAALAINDTRPDETVSQTSLDAWKSTLSSGRVNVSTAQSALQSAIESRESAKSSLDLARQELVLSAAGASKEVIEAQEATYSKTLARRDSVAAELSKTNIRAPFAGVVTKQDAKVGQIAAAGAVLTSMVGDQGFEIEANVPEVDIVRVKANDPVSITFDALPDEVFAGRVGFIDPAETIADGVAYFKIKIFFDKKDPRWKSGLTTNLRIETMRKSGVLTLPQYAIITGDAGTTVKKVGPDQKEVQVPVVLGIRGQNGQVEILSGVLEGEDVVSSVTESL